MVGGNVSFWCRLLGVFNCFEECVAVFFPQAWERTEFLKLEGYGGDLKFFAGPGAEATGSGVAHIGFDGVAVMLGHGMCQL